MNDDAEYAQLFRELDTYMPLDDTDKTIVRIAYNIGKAAGLKRAEAIIKKFTQEEPRDQRTTV